MGRYEFYLAGTAVEGASVALNFAARSEIVGTVDAVAHFGREALRLKNQASSSVVFDLEGNKVSHLHAKSGSGGSRES